MLFESRLKLNEELSVADNAIKVAEMIVDKSLSLLPSLNLESSERLRFFKQTQFDINVNGLIPNTDVLHIDLFAYWFDDEEDYERHRLTLNTNCVSDFETQSIGLRLVCVNGKPNDEFNSSIQHEVNHIYQYANGASKNETLYDRVVKIANDEKNRKKTDLWHMLYI